MAKAKTERKPRARRPKQQHLPEMEPPKVPAIDQATEEYVEVRDHRMELTKREVVLRDKLQILLKENQLTSYEYENYVVRLDVEEKVKVQRKPDTNGEEESDGE